MAARIVFEPDSAAELGFRESVANFDWVPGFALSQKQKSVRNLHRSIISSRPELKPLEISTRSEIDLGRMLSAFNLQTSFVGQITSVECAYQGSKVFEEGGPFTDLYQAPSPVARGDSRLKESGALVGFIAAGESWNLHLGPSFYDYLYLRTLQSHPDLTRELASFTAFTDIAYAQTTTDPKHGRSFNCQARSVAMWCGLSQRGTLHEMLDTWHDILTTSGRGQPAAELGMLF